ncbi:glycosyltransferase family 4 protein [Aeromicrobium duanguangcaii]|uniref:glycosyltransferase family 4 protein n=1 Tax=Aeromicrobium duanguangcaii TaxID=2968086 RepID=UPI00201723BB|nr:glycosyltransferase family 4 protein [Aeromicrobium duanguangcaii]
MTRELLWVSLPDQRPRRELYYMSLMGDTHVTALARDEPVGDLTWVPSTYRRPIKRFIEAGALAWVNELRDQDPAEFDWVASLELCSLVTGQASRWRRRGTGRKPLQAVVTWENLARQPIYKVPPYRQALESCRDAELLLCMVDAARDHLLENRFDDAVIRVVKPGVDTAIFTPASGPVERPVVAFVSPLAENKGIDRILEAMALVRRQIPEAELVVAGRGPLEPLVRAAADDPASGVTLVGGLDAAGVADLLRGAAVFTTAPRPTWKWEEQFGLAYVEAQACGLPVVTTRCGSNHEALAPGNDLLDVEGADQVEALAAQLVAWLTDPARRAEQGAVNRAWVTEHHDLRTQCRRMGDAFSEMERLHGVRS